MGFKLTLKGAQYMLKRDVLCNFLFDTGDINGTEDTFILR